MKTIYTLDNKVVDFENEEPGFKVFLSLLTEQFWRTHTYEQLQDIYLDHPLREVFYKIGSDPSFIEDTKPKNLEILESSKDLEKKD